VKFSKQQFHYITVFFFSVGIWIVLSLFGLLDGIAKEAMRWRYEFRGELEPSSDIVYVDLDAEAISFIGDRPWDRRDFGRLVHALLGAGEANVVGLDIIFSKFGPGALLDVSRARKGDEFFGQVVEHYKDQVVLAAAYTGVYSAISDEDANLLLIRHGFDDPKVIPFPEAPTYPIISFDAGRLGLANVDEELNRGAIPYWVPAFMDLSGARFSLHLVDGAMAHMSEFMDGAQVIAEDGQFKVADKDGWATFSVPDHSNLRLFSLGLEMFLATHRLGPEAVERSDSELVIRKDGDVFRRIPLTHNQCAEVNWFEGWNRDGATPHYSIKMVLEKADALAQASEAADTVLVEEIENWFSRFKDKTVFVGPVDATLKDIAPTPFDREPTPKVAVHANFFRTLDQEAYISRLTFGKEIVITFGLAIIATFLALLGGWGRRFFRVGSLLVILLYAGIVFLSFAQADMVLPLVTPIGAALTSVFCVTSLKLGSEEVQRRRIKNLFGAYVSPELVENMIESHRDPELGGTEAQVTAFFSDVEGFSALSEKLPAPELVSIMNEYLSAMTEALQVEGGTLDKYIGDAIVTMFGMPLPLPDHAARACKASIRMQERHAELRDKWASEGKWPDEVLGMRTRIGLNTGLAVIGNMGSRVRFNYTMMGDSVNLAARCESGAKTYGVYTMITESTLKGALDMGAELRYRRLDRIVVKGRSEPVEIYELWDGSVNQKLAETCREHYEKGFDAYLAGDWNEAIAYFNESLKVEPSASFAPTSPSALLLSRCRVFLESPPTNWDGVYKMKTK